MSAARHHGLWTVDDCTAPSHGPTAFVAASDAGAARALGRRPGRRSSVRAHRADRERARAQSLTASRSTMHWRPGSRPSDRAGVRWAARAAAHTERRRTTRAGRELACSRTRVSSRSRWCDSHGSASLMRQQVVIDGHRGRQADRRTPGATRSTDTSSTARPAQRRPRPRPGPSTRPHGIHGLPRTATARCSREWDIGRGRRSGLARRAAPPPSPLDGCSRTVRRRPARASSRSCEPRRGPAWRADRLRSARWPSAAGAASAGGGRARPRERRCAWQARPPRGIRYLTLPAVRPPTRRFSMIMKSTTTGMIATIDTPNT